jgi:hypothetical protein
MRQGSMREDIALKYNEHGDICESSRTAGGFPHETGTISEPSLTNICSYEYDEHGNWIKKTEHSRADKHEGTYSHARQLTYYR